MKLSELKSVIRSTIKTEVRNAIREELTDIMLGRELQSESTKLASVVKKTKKQPVQQKRFSNNPQLNEILNQTVGFTGANNQALEEDDQTISMDSSVAQSGQLRGRFAQLMGMDVPTGGGSLESNLNQTAAEIGVTPDALPAGVQNMMTKDYSAVLKKIDEKKGKV